MDIKNGYLGLRLPVGFIGPGGAPPLRVCTQRTCMTRSLMVLSTFSHACPCPQDALSGRAIGTVRKQAASQLRSQRSSLQVVKNARDEQQDPGPFSTPDQGVVPQRTRNRPPGQGTAKLHASTASDLIGSMQSQEYPRQKQIQQGALVLDLSQRSDTNLCLRPWLG